MKSKLLIFTRFMAFLMGISHITVETRLGSCHIHILLGVCLYLYCFPGTLEDIVYYFPSIITTFYSIYLL